MMQNKIKLETLETVPYLGAKEPYFLGSGVAGAGGSPDGIWDFLIGPMYSSPNFLEREELFVIIDGIEYQLPLQMHRVQGAGVFHGTAQILDIKIEVSDFTLQNESWAGRRIRIRNGSASLSRKVKVIARIVPCRSVLAFDWQGVERITSFHKPVDSSHTNVIEGGALSIRQDTTAVSYGGEDPNWADRFAFISFSTPCSALQIGESEFSLETDVIILKPGEVYSTGLYHLMHFEEGVRDEEYLQRIYSRDPEQDAADSLMQWHEWLNEGNPLKFDDANVTGIIESIRIFIKMQQCADGGFIAGVRRYAFSYLRDGHGACRGLLAAGHTKEVKHFIEWVHHKYEVFGMIPNSAEMGSDLKMLQFHPPENLASEVTAYYLFVIRDYFRITGDLALLRRVHTSMKYAIDIQLSYAESFDWKLMFNGDETERYVPFRDGDIYGGFPVLPEWKDDDWSFSSLAACIGSLDFYIQFTKVHGEAESVVHYEEKLARLRKSLDDNFWREELGLHDWIRHKDGSFPMYRVPNLLLLPFWFGASLNENRERSNAVRMAEYVNEKGFLPLAPGVNEGFCGHSLGYLLYALAKTGDSRAANVFRTLTEQGIVGCWGTVSEFYGPGGVANPHNLRVFESGINLDAMLVYLKVLHTSR